MSLMAGDSTTLYWQVIGSTIRLQDRQVDLTLLRHRDPDATTASIDDFRPTIRHDDAFCIAWHGWRGSAYHDQSVPPGISAWCIRITPTMQR
jgi:hypothetical protein